MEPIKTVKDRYLVVVDESYKPTRKNPPSDLDLVQDSSNCWLIGSDNNWYAQTWKKIPVDTFNAFAKKYRLDTTKWNDWYYWMALYCEFFKKSNLILGKLDVIKYPLQFAEFMRNKYTFAISRVDISSFHMDIKDNWVVNKIHEVPKVKNPKDIPHHRTNISFDWKFFCEDWTYSKKSKFDKFKYDYKIFRELVKNWFIDQNIYFIDYRK